jgi:hypothetical protein
VGELRDAIGHAVGKSTSSVTTSAKPAIFTTFDLGNSIRQEVGKQTPSLDMPVVATPIQENILAHIGQGKPTDTK